MDWLRDWTKKIDMRHIKFGKELLNKYEFLEVENIVIGFADDDGINIPDVYVTGFTEKGVQTEKGYEDKGTVFFKRDGLIKIALSYYPFRFSIPKSQLVSFETDEKGIDQTIKITEWGYHNCYMLPYNKIYEDWGRMMYSLFSAYTNGIWDEAPMYKYSVYKPVVEKIKKLEIRESLDEIQKVGIRKAIKEYKEKKLNRELGIEV